MKVTRARWRTTGLNYLFIFWVICVDNPLSPYNYFHCFNIIIFVSGNFDYKIWKMAKMGHHWLEITFFYNNFIYTAFAIKKLSYNIYYLSVTILISRKQAFLLKYEKWPKSVNTISQPLFQVGDNTLYCYLDNFILRAVKIVWKRYI